MVFSFFDPQSGVNESQSDDIEPQKLFCFSRKRRKKAFGTKVTKTGKWEGSGVELCCQPPPILSPVPRPPSIFPTAVDKTRAMCLSLYLCRCMSQEATETTQHSNLKNKISTRFTPFLVDRNKRKI